MVRRYGALHAGSDARCSRASLRLGGGLGRGEDRVGEAGKRGSFETQLSAAFRRECIKLCATIVLGCAPIGLDPAAGFEAVEGGVERALLDAEDVVGGLFDPAGDAVTVRRSPAYGFEDQEVERAAEDFD